MSSTDNLSVRLPLTTHGLINRVKKTCSSGSVLKQKCNPATEQFIRSKICFLLDCCDPRNCYDPGLAALAYTSVSGTLQWRQIEVVFRSKVSLLKLSILRKQ